MAFVLETGVGVRNANAYVTPAFVTTYLTDLGRETQNSWSTSTAAEQQEAIVAATHYIDSVFGDEFAGIKLTVLEGRQARGFIEVGSNPSATETLTVGSKVYTFVSALTTLGLNQILIGATAADTQANIIAALTSGAGRSTVYSDLTEENGEITAGEDTTSGDIIVAAAVLGESGNDTPLSTTAGALTITAMAGGLDDGEQPLEFPRRSLFTRAGRAIDGIPLDLKKATAEYAVRARGSSLFVDPTVDPTGRTVVEKEERVGPILERTRYEDSSVLAQLIKPYPEADALLVPFLKSSGRTVR